MRTRGCAAALLLAVLTACGGEPGPGADAPPSASGATPDSDAWADESGSADDPPPTTADDPTPSRTRKPTRPGTRVVASGSEFGRVLFGSTGQAIYLVDAEPTSKPRCYDSCAESWPPVLTTGDPVAGRGVDGSLLGTTERTDGTVQVTYNDHPLYFYAHEGTGEVKCHDVFLDGGNWYVVRPDGDAAPPG